MPKRHRQRGPAMRLCRSSRLDCAVGCKRRLSVCLRRARTNAWIPSWRGLQNGGDVACRESLVESFVKKFVEMPLVISRPLIVSWLLIGSWLWLFFHGDPTRTRCLRSRRSVNQIAVSSSHRTTSRWPQSGKCQAMISPVMVLMVGTGQATRQNR